MHDDKTLSVDIYVKDNFGERKPIPYPDLILMTALNPPHGSAHGVSILRGLPFVSEVLLKIYKSIGMNWDRVGNVRFAVTYKPTSDPMDRAYAKERAQQIATEWSRCLLYTSIVHKYGDNVDTDVIIPARYLNTASHSELAAHCMEDIDKDFVNKVKQGDIIVANKNFGCGSSREHAPIAIKASGISCVIASTFARIFYRNAINIGLAILECDEAAKDIKDGDEVKVDFDTGVICLLYTSKAGRISDESLIGKSLLGHTVGDKVEVEVPAGVMLYEVLSISK